MSSPRPWTHQTGTSSGTCRIGSTSASCRPGRVAEERLDRAATEAVVVRRRAGRARRPARPRGSGRRAPAAQVTRWPPAEWPIPTTVGGRAGRAVDRGRDVGEGVGRAGAAAVLDRPGRPAALDQARHQRRARTRCRTPASRSRRAPAPPRPRGHRRAGSARRTASGSSPYAISRRPTRARRSRAGSPHRSVAAGCERDQPAQGEQAPAAHPLTPKHGAAAWRSRPPAARRAAPSNSPSTSSASPPVRPSAVTGTPCRSASATSRSASAVGRR